MTQQQPPVDPDKLDYRPCVGVMLINRAGLVWVGQRADTPGEAEGEGNWWQMPQGGLDEGEDPLAAAFRELYEETSVRSATLLGQTSGWLTYDLPPHLIGVAMRRCAAPTLAPASWCCASAPPPAPCCPTSSA